MLNKHKLKKLSAKKQFFAKVKSFVYLLACLTSPTSPTQLQEKNPKLISEN